MPHFFSNSIFVLLTIYTQALVTPHRRSVQSPSKSVNSWMFLYTAMEYTTTYSFLLLHPSLLWFIDFGSSATTGVFFTEFVFKLFPLSFPFAGWSWRSLQIKHKYYQMVLISLCSIPFAFLNTVYRVIFCPMLFCFYSSTPLANGFAPSWICPDAVEWNIYSF